MNYDTIIVEMLSRIQTLEKRVELLEKNNISDNDKNINTKITTKDIKDLIVSKIQVEKDKGNHSLVILANDIHKELGLISRMPMVCNAMHQLEADYKSECLFSTPSKQSSTLKIEYFF